MFPVIFLTGHQERHKTYKDLQKKKKEEAQVPNIQSSTGKLTEQKALGANKNNQNTYEKNAQSP